MAPEVFYDVLNIKFFNFGAVEEMLAFSASCWMVVGRGGGGGGGGGGSISEWMNNLALQLGTRWLNGLTYKIPLALGKLSCMMYPFTVISPPPPPPQEQCSVGKNFQGNLFP